MKAEYIAIGLVLTAIGVGGFYYLESQLNAQIDSSQVGEEFLQSSEMTNMFEKVRLGLLVTALAGVGISGYGVIGRDKPSHPATLGKKDSHIIDAVFCRHCGMPGAVSGYCAGCGQGRQVSSTVFRRCAHCGKNASDDSEFCTSCGWKF